MITWINLTIETTSLAIKARISAQETTPGHLSSRADFTPFITWNPLKVWFGRASISAWLSLVEFSSIEPSHPYKEKGHLDKYFSIKAIIYVEEKVKSQINWIIIVQQRELRCESDSESKVY